MVKLCRRRHARTVPVRSPCSRPTDSKAGLPDAFEIVRRIDRGSGYEAPAAQPRRSADRRLSGRPKIRRLADDGSWNGPGEEQVGATRESRENYTEEALIPTFATKSHPTATVG